MGCVTPNSWWMESKKDLKCLAILFGLLGKIFSHMIQQRGQTQLHRNRTKSLISSSENLLEELWRVRLPHLTGSVRSPLRRSISLWGTGYQRKLSFQLKPPYVMSDPAMYSNVSSLMTSMMGHTTVFLEEQSDKQNRSHRENEAQLANRCKMLLFAFQLLNQIQAKQKSDNGISKC